MVADCAYSPGLRASMDQQASLVYFAAAVPAVGFVHGPAGLNPLNASYAERGFLRRGSLHHQGCGLWPRDGLPNYEGR
jgi:hypothetical protein